jgi:uncharacterized protein
MDLTLDRPGEHLYVRTVNQQGIRIGDQWYSGTIVLTPDQVIEDWPPATVQDVQARHLQVLLALQPEVLLLGTGARQSFLPPAVMADVYRAGAGMEVMTTDAACRTFNLLAGDGRKVVAALLPIRADQPGL